MLQLLICILEPLWIVVFFSLNQFIQHRRTLFSEWRFWRYWLKLGDLILWTLVFLAGLSRCSFQAAFGSGNGHSFGGGGLCSRDEAIVLARWPNAVLNFEMKPLNVITLLLVKEAQLMVLHHVANGFLWPHLNPFNFSFRQKGFSKDYIIFQK